MVEPALAFDRWRESNSFFRSVMDSLPELGVVITDMAGDIQYWNDGARQIFGYRAEDIRDRSIALLFVPEDRAAQVDVQERAQALAAGQVTDERWKLRQDGTRCFVSSSMQRIRFEELEGFVKVMRDETHRVQLGELGLGAAIVGTLPELHHWTLRTGNKGPDAWAAFILQQEAAPGKIAGADQPTAGGGRPLSILLVEDHQDTARLMARLLARYRHYVTIAPTVAEALRQLQTQRFDLLLSDLSLPDGTGLDVVKAAKTTQGIPSIALTGHSLPKDVTACTQAGFDEHLTKPINFQKLEELLRKYGAVL